METLNFILKLIGEKGNKSKIIVYRSRYALFPKLINNLGFRTGAEVGVSSGYYSKHLCSFCPKFKLYSIDAWQLFSGCTHGETQAGMNSLYQKAVARLASFKNNQIIRDWSMNAVKLFKNESLDFVYIDAAHDYQSVHKDISVWSKRVKKGGIIAGHDYTKPHAKDGCPKSIFDVQHAVNDWVKENKIKPLFLLTNKNDTSWFYIK